MQNKPKSARHKVYVNGIHVGNIVGYRPSAHDRSKGANACFGISLLNGIHVESNASYFEDLVKGAPFLVTMRAVEALVRAFAIEPSAKRRMRVRNKQCAKCPWRVDVDPNDIPNGYCSTKHANLDRTIANPGEIRIGGELRMMACHESMLGKECPCVGWLVHQLGRGNNIALRFLALDGRFNKLETIGEQHETFEDTLPED